MDEDSYKKMHPIHRGTVFIGKKQCSTDGVGTTKYLHAKEWSRTHTYLTQYTKIKSH